MTKKSTKKNFHIRELYTFRSNYENSSAVISLTPLVSSSKYVGGLRPYYQQSKFSLSSPTSSLLSSRISSVGIHTTAGDSLSSNKILENNILKDEDSSLSSDKV
jgi:hypothetical protein